MFEYTVNVTAQIYRKLIIYKVYVQKYTLSLLYTTIRIRVIRYAMCFLISIPAIAFSVIYPLACVVYSTPEADRYLLQKTQH